MEKKFDEYIFGGDRGIPMAVMGVAVIDRGLIGFGGENVVEMRVSGAGMVYAASEVNGVPDFYDQNYPNSIYIHGSENYDGIRRLYNVRAGRFPQFYSPYIAETPAGVTMRVGFLSPVACEFGGFKVRVPEVSGLSSILDVIVYSAKGAAWDNLVFSQDMAQVRDIHNMFETPIPLAPNDRIDLTWPDSNRERWGISLYTRKLK